MFSWENCKIFTKSFFDRNSPVASVDLLFKSNVGWFLLRRVDLVIVRVISTLLAEAIPTHFYWLICRNQKLVQSEPLQQKVYVFVHYLMAIVMYANWRVAIFVK